MIEPWTTFSDFSTDKSRLEARTQSSNLGTGLDIIILTSREEKSFPVCCSFRLQHSGFCPTV